MKWLLTLRRLTRLNLRKVLTHDLVWVWLVFVVVYVILPVKPYLSYDNHGTAEVPIALVRGDGFDLRRFAMGQETVQLFLKDPKLQHYYVRVSQTGMVINNFPVFTAIAIVPFYVLYGLWQPTLWQDLQFGPPTWQANYLAAVGLTTLTAYLWYLMARQLGLKKAPAIALALMGIFATPVISTSSRFVWQHTVALVFVSAALWWYLKRAYFFMALAAVFAVLARPATIPLLAPLGIFFLVQIWQSVRTAWHVNRGLSGWPRIPATVFVAWQQMGVETSQQKLVIALMIGVALLMQVWYSKMYIGNWLSFAPQYEYSRLGWWDLQRGLPGQLASPGRGLFFYSPMFLLALVGLVHWRRSTSWWVVGLVLYHGVCGAWDMWHGGWSLGYRLVMDGLPIWLYGFGIFVKEYWPRHWWWQLPVYMAIGWAIFLNTVVSGKYEDCNYNATPTNIDSLSYADRQKRLWTEYPLMHRCLGRWLPAL